MDEKENKYLVENAIIKKLSTDISTSGFDVNASDDEGRTILHLASQMGMDTLVKFLLEHGSNINQKDCFGRTPIMLACFAGHENIVNTLMFNDALINFNDFYGFNILTLAVYGGTNMVKYLYAKSITNESDNNYLGNMPLLALASSVGNEELVNFIMSKDPGQINIAVEKTGMTPIMLAICGGYVKLVKKLIKYGANSNKTSKASLSSVCYALKLSFPLLELKIPELTQQKQENLLTPDFIPKHPLTPNLCLSPVKNGPSPKKCINWLKRVRRSRSLDNKKKCKKNDSPRDDIKVLKSIFQIAKLQQYWPIFKEQQISFKTFLTMDDEDLCSIGIKKISVRNKILTLIEHYNHIFYL